MLFSIEEKFEVCKDFFVENLCMKIAIKVKKKNRRIVFNALELHVCNTYLYKNSEAVSYGNKFVTFCWHSGCSARTRETETDGVGETAEGAAVIGESSGVRTAGQHQVSSQ